MCKRGDVVKMSVRIPIYDVEPCAVYKLEDREIDRCIAPLVDALGRAGMFTRASCCGHGELPGSIALWDGRELLITDDYDKAREVESILRAREQPSRVQDHATVLYPRAYRGGSLLDALRGHNPDGPLVCTCPQCTNRAGF